MLTRILVALVVVVLGLAVVITLQPATFRVSRTTTIAPAPAGTTVTWTMSGDNDFLSKAFSLFMGGMDKMIGPDFEKGLAQLKAVAEAKK